MQENLEELATLESLDNGKPYTIAKTVDVPMASHSTLTLHAETVIPMLIMFKWDATSVLDWGFTVINSPCSPLTVWQSQLYESQTCQGAHHLPSFQRLAFNMQSIEHLRYYGGWAYKIYGAVHTSLANIAFP